MKIAAASDHAGFEVKDALVRRLRDEGHEVDDLGADGPEPRVDYPEYAGRVARAVLSGEAERGVLVCGSGLGMCMAANRYKGIRAANCLTEYLAEMSRRHNDANVICLPGRLLTPEEAWPILEVWLATPFDGGRYERRANALDELPKA